MKQTLLPLISESETSVTFRDDIPTSDLFRYGVKVAKEARSHQCMFDSCQWRIGDWFNFSKNRADKDAESCSKFAVARLGTGYMQESLENIARVCAAIPPPLRNGELLFGHHVVVYRLPPGKQKQYLDAAVASKLTVRELRKLVSEKEATCNEGDEYLIPQAVPLLKRVALFQMEIQANYLEARTWPKERKQFALGEVDKTISALQDLRRELVI